MFNLVGKLKPSLGPTLLLVTFSWPLKSGLYYIHSITSFENFLRSEGNFLYIICHFIDVISVYMYNNIIRLWCVSHFQRTTFGHFYRYLHHSHRAAVFITADVFL